MEYIEIKKALESNLKNAKIVQTDKLEIINDCNGKKIMIEIDENLDFIVYVFDKYHTHFSRNIEFDTLLERISEILSDDYVVVAEYVNSKYKASRVIKFAEVQSGHKFDIVVKIFGKDEIKNLYLNGGKIVISSWSGNLDKEIIIQKGEFC